ncbi:MAG: hypothetical protein JJ992_22625, partial [Planctomycetes bacterium]|nr:hypothetical protein [Planctomycetota bacterium]
MNQRSATDSDVVVTWKNGKLRQDDLDILRNSHSLTVRFLDVLIQRAIQAGGTPVAPGLNRDQMGQIRDPGIPRSYAEEDLVQTVILAQRAKDMGVVVSDQAILEFLDGLAANKVPRSEYPGLLREATNGRFVQQQLFEQLRTELQAQQLRMLANSGLMAITPADAWDCFNRLNRRVQAELLPFPVEDFVSKVTAEPTADEVKHLYEEGKDRYPNPYSPEPGFKRPLKIAFEYLKTDFDVFLQAEMAKVTDQQVREYYEQNKQDFKVPELPPVEDEPATDEPAKPAADAKGDETPEPEAPVKPEEKADGSTEGGAAPKDAPDPTSPTSMLPGRDVFVSL